MVLRDGQHVISEYAYGQFNIYAWNTASDYNRNHKPDFDRNHLIDAADQAALQGRASYGSGTTTDEPYFDSNQDGRLDAQDYSPGAVPPRSSSPCGNPFFFTGRLTDTLFANNPLQQTYRRVQDNRNRAYDPKHGRWLQRDPLGTQVLPHGGRVALTLQYHDGHNLHQYVDSNAGNSTDPNGLYKTVECCSGQEYCWGQYPHTPWQDNERSACLAAETDCVEFGGYCGPWPIQRCSWRIISNTVPIIAGITGTHNGILVEVSDGYSVFSQWEIHGGPDSGAMKDCARNKLQVTVNRTKGTLSVSDINERSAGPCKCLLEAANAWKTCVPYNFLCAPNCNSAAACILDACGLQASPASAWGWSYLVVKGACKDKKNLPDCKKAQWDPTPL